MEPITTIFSIINAIWAVVLTFPLKCSRKAQKICIRAKIVIIHAGNVLEQDRINAQLVAQIMIVELFLTEFQILDNAFVTIIKSNLMEFACQGVFKILLEEEANIVTPNVLQTLGHILNMIRQLPKKEHNMIVLLKHLVMIMTSILNSIEMVKDLLFLDQRIKLFFLQNLQFLSGSIPLLLIQKVQ